MGQANELLFIDTETGGLDHSQDALLSVGLVHWRDGAILGQQEIWVQPEGLHVGTKALEVNRIDMAHHRKFAVSRREASERMYRLVRSWMPWSSEKQRVILAGHNVGFDINFVRPLFGGYWSKLVLHRSVDTSTLLQFLAHTGRIPAGKEASLDQAVRLFGINIPDELRHTALADALGTAELYTRLVNLVSLSTDQPEQERLFDERRG